MAERRMFAKAIIDSDAFLDMPSSSQTLYFHLSMRADDDGFVNNPKRIMRMVGCGEDDMRLLLAKKFIIAFESGVVVIKHWRIHNYIRSDRYKETNYKEEKSLLTCDENNSYTIGIPTVYQLVDERDTQVRLGKDRLGKVKEEKGKRFARPSLDEVSEYIKENGYGVDPQRFMDFYESNGWKVGRNPMKDWKATVRSWQSRDNASKPKQDPNKGKQSYCPHCNHPAWRNTQNGTFFCDSCRSTIQKSEVVWR